MTRQDPYEDLVTKYPLLYADRHASMRTTCMCWGFECGLGWYNIISELSAKLEVEIQKWIAEHPGNEQEHPRASQVKEKFGGMRYYLTHGTDRMHELVSEAEALTETTCENCGAPGECNDSGWITCRCESCREAERKGREVGSC